MIVIALAVMGVRARTAPIGVKTRDMTGRSGFSMAVR
jgi:hypothetical protein